MNDESKCMGLLTQVAKGLLLHSTKETASQLGDRSTYIGMSDIGKGSECMRAAVANKVYGNKLPTPEEVLNWHDKQDYEKVQAVLNKQLILQRGHWLEAGILQAFKANGVKIFSQLEIDIYCNGTPVKAHLDFALIWGGKRPAVRILELKSTENIPKNLYSAYETQLYGQLGFLCKFWNKPCFGLKSETGQNLYKNLTFPELAKKVFNVNLPENSQEVDIEGWVLCLAMSEAKAFGPYKSNPTMTRFCEKIAKSIWNSAEDVKDGRITLNELDYCKGFHPLCDWCSHLEDCPKFKALKLKDSSYNYVIKELENLKKKKSKLEDDIKLHEKRIKDFYRNSGLRNEWLNTGDFKFKCTEVNGRKTLDEAALIAELSKGMDEGKIEEALGSFRKTGTPYQRLYITKNKEK